MARSVGDKTKQFKLGAGAVCLDFCNTAADRITNELRKTIRTYSNLIEWCKAANLLTPQDYKRLAGLSFSQTKRTRRALRKTIELREVIYRVFSSLASGKTPEYGDLSLLTFFWSAAAARMKLKKSAAAFKLSLDADDLEYPLRRIAASAMELLVSDKVLRVRRCASPTCDWLFLDQSKNRTRRWCDMQVCGSRLKSRRYYKKIRSSRRMTVQAD